MLAGGHHVPGLTIVKKLMNITEFATFVFLRPWLFILFISLTKTSVTNELNSIMIHIKHVWQRKHWRIKFYTEEATYSL